MLRLALWVIALGGTAALAAEADRRPTFPRRLLTAAMAVGGSACGFVAVQTAFRLGRLARNRGALQPKEPTGSCLVTGWRMAVGVAAFLAKAVLGIAFWILLHDFFRDGFR